MDEVKEEVPQGGEILTESKFAFFKMKGKVIFGSNLSKNRSQNFWVASKSKIPEHLNPLTP